MATRLHSQRRYVLKRSAPSLVVAEKKGKEEVSK